MLKPHRLFWSGSALSVVMALLLLSGSFSQEVKTAGKKEAGLDLLSDWPMFRGNARRTGVFAKGGIPLPNYKRWERPTIRDKNDVVNEVEKGREAKVWLDRALERIKDQPVVAGAFPVVVGNLLCYRSHLDVRAVYLRDGKDEVGDPYKAGQIAWQATEFDGAIANVLTDASTRPILDNWLNQFTQASALSLLCENGLTGTLSTDGRWVYAIDDLQVPVPTNIFLPSMWNSGQVPQDVKPLLLANSLHAYGVAHGKFQWRLGDRFKRDDPFAGSHFLGPPLPLEGQLFVLNEKNEGPTGTAELRLVCLSAAKGEVIGALVTLAKVPQARRVTHDPMRRTNAAHLAYANGVLVCPTNAGEVFGVDRQSRRVLWTYSYRGEAKAPAPLPKVFPAGMTPVPQPQWKASAPLIAGDRVILTAPDEAAIHCLSLGDGTVRWKRERRDDLYVAGIFADKVLLIGTSACRTLDLADGREVWSAATGTPAGMGAAGGSLYYLPLLKTAKSDEPGICVIDPAKGQVLKTVETRKALAGNLLFYDNQVLVQTPTTVAAYPQFQPSKKD
jgi:hypothetical protein